MSVFKMTGELQKWLCILVFLLILLKKTKSSSITITYVESAVAKGGVCLDGSAPAYHWDRGSGDGINNWLVHLEGGAWCSSRETCLARKDTRLGSSKLMSKQVVFSGIFNNKKVLNPDFYNWNRVKVRYCDGSSFTGDIEDVDPETGLYYRGARVFAAVMEDLFEKGMSNAQNAQNMLQDIQTPLFFVNAAYDSWQIKNILASGAADPHGKWNACKAAITKCSPDQIEIMQSYRQQFIESLINALDSSESAGYFINPCYTHCQTETQETWLSQGSPLTIAKAVRDWYYDRSLFQGIDCQYSCDKTCYNQTFEPSEM
ncbi:pectinacetylesterase family protein [Striga asiatica]|uniref:Pectin acetylesterase n=1 Tax=Striga asiatica TaxID=4170 RepID=A0A5A7PC87_STRAF|nr:pectinacetylesterase family protein [Striga asiatica]